MLQYSSTHTESCYITVQHKQYYVTVQFKTQYYVTVQFNTRSTMLY